MNPTAKTPFETILTTSAESILTITINRPSQLNALNRKVLAEIEQVISHELTNKIRIIVFRGSGQKAFVAGADISEMSQYGPEAALEFSRAGHRLLRTLETLPQVVIAGVGGYAFGGGCELALACDLVIAGMSAQFAQPEVNLGLIPGFGGTQRLVGRVGLPLALDLLLTGRGRILTAAEALAAGLVSRVVADSELDEEIAKVSASIIKAGPTAVAEAKRLCREAATWHADMGLNAEAVSFASCFTRSEAREGMNAFLAKRKPQFS